MYNYPIYNQRFGKGKSFVLFLHGWGGSTNSFLSIAKRLSVEHRVMLIDFYGFGKSKYPNVSLDTYEYALQVFLYLTKKGVKELDIVAHSFGGRVAMLLASVFDIKVNNLVLVSSAGILPKKSLAYKYKVIKYKILKKLTMLKIYSNKKLTTYGSDEYKQLDELQKIGYVKIVNQGLEDFIVKIKSRTIIVWGDSDKTTPLYMANKIHKLIDDSKLLIYENAGHFSFVENYGNFCNLLLTFLKV